MLTAGIKKIIDKLVQVFGKIDSFLVCKTSQRRTFKTHCLFFDD